MELELELMNGLVVLSDDSSGGVAEPITDGTTPLTDGTTSLEDGS